MSRPELGRKEGGMEGRLAPIKINAPPDISIRLPPVWTGTLDGGVGEEGGALRLPPSSGLGEGSRGG